MTILYIWNTNENGTFAGYIEDQGPGEIAVIFIFVTPRKTEFFIIALFRVEQLVSVKMCLLSAEGGT